MLHNVLATLHLGHWGTIGCLRHENKQSISCLPLSVTSDFGDLIISIVNHHYCPNPKLLAFARPMGEKNLQKAISKTLM